VVLAVGARLLLAGRNLDESRTMIRMALGLLAVLAPLQLLIGDLHGLNTLKHQPIKIAAMEAHWEDKTVANFHIFAWPDEKAERNRFAISIPGAASFILTHNWKGLVPGLKGVPPSERPPVVSVFFAFRIMLAIGFFMIAAALYGAGLMLSGRLFETRWYLRVVSHAWWTGFVAVLAGWIVTESGRQPWLVHGILRTADAVSPLPGAAVGTTLILFVLVYGIVFAMGIYYINRLINRGLQETTVQPTATGGPSRPLAAARQAEGVAPAAGG
jgi:cytochrome d ubiquinol oxidase subunit I